MNTCSAASCTATSACAANHHPALDLPAQRIDTAEARTRTLLETAHSKLGFIPNTYAYMANAPHLLETYLLGYDRFRTDSGLTPVEQEIVLLTVSRENQCDYCTAAHCFMADNMAQVPSAVTQAILDQGEIPEPRLRALHQFTRVLVDRRGKASREEVAAFLAAGYEQRHVLDILLAIAVKTISNYANHLFDTPIDDLFGAKQ